MDSRELAEAFEKVNKSPRSKTFLAEENPIEDYLRRLGAPEDAIPPFMDLLDKAFGQAERERRLVNPHASSLDLDDDRLGEITLEVFEEANLTRSLGEHEPDPGSLGRGDTAL